jgi:hypothetical protein
MRGNVELNGKNFDVLFVVTPAPNLPDFALSSPIEAEPRKRAESSEIKQLQRKVGGAGRNRTDA